MSEHAGVVRTGLAATTVSISHEGDTLRLRRADTNAEAIARVVAPTATICPAYPPDAVLLGTATIVSGVTFAALDAALAYHAAHPWPTAHPAHPDDPGTTVYVETRGKYLYVDFADDSRLAPGWDTCNR